MWFNPKILEKNKGRQNVWSWCKSAHFFTLISNIVPLRTDSSHMWRKLIKYYSKITQNHASKIVCTGCSCIFSWTFLYDFVPHKKLCRIRYKRIVSSVIVTIKIWLTAVEVWKRVVCIQVLFHFQFIFVTGHGLSASRSKFFSEKLDPVMAVTRTRYIQIT